MSITINQIRKEWEKYSSNPSEQSIPINWGVVKVIDSILSYLEDAEKAPKLYIPEPRLGPQHESEEQAVERGKALGEIIRAAEEKLAETRKNEEEPKLCTTSGEPVEKVRAEQTETTGMHKSYIVLCPEERAKGFVRPYRESYKHVGIRPRFSLRDLNDEEKERYGQYGYIKYEEYPESESPKTGRFWTEKELNSGCGCITTMSRALSETYARDPEFYGSTFCTGCNVHLPVREFQWLDGETVGS